MRLFERIAVAATIVAVCFALGAAWQFDARPTLYVFCSTNCVPCEALKRAYADHGTNYNLIEGHALSAVQFVTWDVDRRRWSDGSRAHNAFVKATGGRIAAFPTLWLSGSATYKVGYP